MQTMLTYMFADVESINIELEKISANKVVTKDQRLKKNLCAVGKVKKDNSYTKDDMIYLKMDQWTKIVKELAAVDMMQ